MSTVVDSSIYGDDLAAILRFSFPDSLENFARSRSNVNSGNRGVSSIPADILETPKEYIFYLDVPGLSKSDFQVTVEDRKTLVVKSNGKRKREDVEEERSKYIRLERRAPGKLLRKFRLPENANVSAISAKCESGVLTVVVEKVPPQSKFKRVEVPIA